MGCQPKYLLTHFDCPYSGTCATDLAADLQTYHINRYESLLNLSPSPELSTHFLDVSEPRNVSRR
jgi:hypothetical protein